MNFSRFVGFGLLGALAIFVSMASSSWARDDDAPVSGDQAELEIQTALAELGKAGCAAAQAQRWCAVTPHDRLGAMGKPVKIILDGKPVFLCCAGCEEESRANAKATLDKVEKMKRVNSTLSKLSAADRELAEAQRYCAVRGKSELGSMGTPVKVMLEGQPVFLCCAACQKAATANPKAALGKLNQ